MDRQGSQKVGVSKVDGSGSSVAMHAGLSFDVSALQSEQPARPQELDGTDAPLTLQPATQSADTHIPTRPLLTPDTTRKIPAADNP
eukprot:1376088-Rhodomonas_salina.1